MKKILANPNIKKLVIIGAVVLLGILTMYFFLIYLPDQKDKKGASDAAGAASGGSSSSTSGGGPTPTIYNNACPALSNANTIAQKGSKCIAVLKLQKYLNKNKGASLIEDGDWGQKTQDALDNAKFQIPNLGKGNNYATLTKALYNTLGLDNY
jgi:hypothetical protein